MAHGFDELVNFLLDEVALRFAEGLTLHEFKNSVVHFYSDGNARNDTIDANIDRELLNTVNHVLLEKTWTWLLAHNDIWVGKIPTSDDEPPQILVTAEQGATTLSLRDAEAIDSEQGSVQARIRVWTSHERVWQTVAGHGVDFKRIPGEEFRLLCIIAGSRDKGIAQPELVKRSKQDKKSVPGRTDNLNKSGYIRKTRILAEKHNTSLLTHRRFVQAEQLNAIDRPVFVNGSLSFENLLAVLTERLKNGVTIRMDDLEADLGCSVKSWEKRALWRALERLDIIGVVQRYRQDEEKLGKRGVMRIFKTRTVKLLREPTDDDFKRYTSLTVKDRNDFRKRLEAQDAETQGEHKEYMEDDDYAPLDPDVTMDSSEAPVEPVREAVVYKMRWDSDVAWTNTVFNAIESAGAAGLSSMAARESTYGRFYDRPVEQMLARLTDVWQNAQPAHLKHFNIIRDTDTKGRSTNYQYRTHEAFQKAVDEGSTVWENATNGGDYQKPQPQLDRFGFHVLDQSQFLAHGTATLAQGITNVHSRPERLQKGDPILETNADGSERLAWTHVPSIKIEKKVRTPRRPKAEISAAKEAKRAQAAKEGRRRPGRPKKNKDVTFPVSTQSAKPGVVAPAEHSLRLRAERQAYDEAKIEQKTNPITLLPGKQITAVWKPVGRGHLRMTLVDDSQPSESMEQTEPAPKGKRVIVVLESRVQVIMQTLRDADAVTASTFSRQDLDVTQISTPASKHRVIALVSPRLGELAWFQDATCLTASAGANAEPAPVTRTITPVTELEAIPAEKRTDSTRAESLTSGAQADRSASEIAPTTPIQRTTSVQPSEDVDWLGQLEQASEQITTPRRVGEVALSTGTPRKDWAQRQSTYIRPSGPTAADRKKRGTVVGRGTAQYKRILLIKQIMEKSGGIFPGDSEMVPAFQKLQKTELKSETTSDRDTVMKAVKALVDDQKLNRFAFFFKGINGKEVQKFVLHEPHIKVDSPEVKDLMKKIEEAHPRNYVPPPYGEGETSRAEQRKNIDRFQYRPGKSIIQPSGTEFVIDIEAKRRELEAQREAVMAAIRADEMKRLKEQAARNRKRNAAIARKPRKPRTEHLRTAQPQPWSLNRMAEADPDRVMPSVETGDPAMTAPLNQHDRLRYRDIRPATLMTELAMAALQSGAPLRQEEPLSALHPSTFSHPVRSESPLPGGHTFASSSRRASKHQQKPKLQKQTSSRRISACQLKQARYTFRENQGPQFYDRFYELQDIPTLLQPQQRFHPSTGTFSTDYFVRINVRHSHWVEPAKWSFENHTSTDPRDVQMYTATDDLDSHYHPYRQERKLGSGLAYKKMAQYTEPRYDRDLEFHQQDFEKQELRIMRQEFPGLIHERPQDGFHSYTFGDVQQTAEDIYGYGIRPMEHIILHGADPEDFQGVQFEEHNRRPINPVEYTVDTSSDDDDEGEAPRVARAARTPKKPKRARKTLSDQVTRTVNDRLPPASVRAIKAAKNTGIQSGKCQLSVADSRRLFFACIAVRVICAGFESAVNWSLIGKIFETHANYDLPTFKARWNRMWNTHNDIVSRVHLEFQNAFLAAYDAGLVPPLDVVHGNQLQYKDITKWNHMLDWAVKAVPVFSDEISLPNTRDALSDSFFFNIESPDVQEQREKMEHIYSTHGRREDLAHSASFSAPLVHRPRVIIDDVGVARSWIRANCATSDDVYDAERANARLQKLNQELLIAITKEMHADKIIAHNFKTRNKAAKNFHLSEQYALIFNRRPLEAKNFSEALAFKCELDKVFASDSPRLILDQSEITEGREMAIVEMLAAGRIVIRHVLPPINSTIGAPWPRLTVWGFTEGHYKLRNMDRKIFTWGIEVLPASGYTAGFAARIRSEQISAPMCPQEDVEDRERIPLWYDILGNFIPVYWEALLRSVVQHMAMKAGSTIAMLTAPYRGLVWEWEIRLLVDWLVQVGVAEISKNGSVRAKEWWWMVVPKQVANGENETALDDALVSEQVTPAAKKRRVRGGKAQSQSCPAALFSLAGELVSEQADV